MLMLGKPNGLYHISGYSDTALVFHGVNVNAETLLREVVSIDGVPYRVREVLAFGPDGLMLVVDPTEVRSGRERMMC